MTGVNVGVISNAAAPFGDIKQSGIGREGQPRRPAGVPGRQVRHVRGPDSGAGQVMWCRNVRMSSPGHPRAWWRGSGCGAWVLATPLLNRGTAFTLDEREALGLTGLLPDGVSTIEGQLHRVYAQYLRQPDDLAKNMYLGHVRDRNEVLFYRLLTEHISEMLPIVYTPTVGTVIERYSLEFGRPRGVYLSVDHPDQVETAFRNYGLGPDDVDLIVATDSEGILGIGDWGVAASRSRSGSWPSTPPRPACTPAGSSRSCWTPEPTTRACWARNVPGHPASAGAGRTV